MLERLSVVLVFWFVAVLYLWIQVFVDNPILIDSQVLKLPYLHYLKSLQNGTNSQSNTVTTGARTVLLAA